MNSVKLGGFDYLGLASDSRIAEELGQVAHEEGISPTGGRYSIGWTEHHDRLERNLEQFFSVDSACIQGAGYLGGPAFFRGMASDYGTVFYDEYSHSNLILGMKGGDYDAIPYDHLDPEDLRARGSEHSGPPPIIATDGIFSISGEVAPLNELFQIASRWDALLFVDDAHGVFACGPEGRGTVAMCEGETENVVFMGSMSKALGVYGGFIAGPERLIEQIKHAPNYIGSTPPPVPIAAACARAIEILQQEPDRRKRMRTVRDRMIEIVRNQEIELLSDPRVPVVTMQLDSEQEARELVQHLNEEGLELRYLEYPSEPREGLVRTAARSVYSDAVLDRFENVVATLFS